MPTASSSSNSGKYYDQAVVLHPGFEQTGPRFAGTGAGGAGVNENRRQPTPEERAVLQRRGREKKEAQSLSYQMAPFGQVYSLRRPRDCI